MYERELQKLEDLSRSGTACLVVIKGPRNIGKSRLIEEFGKDKLFLPFKGLAHVKKATAQDQLDAFAHQLILSFRLPPFYFKDWFDGFAHLSMHLTDAPTVILFDEISWMGSKDHTFIPKLKAWWDLSLQQYPSLILILCGSNSRWIDKNIINSKALFGRVSLYLELTERP